MLFPTHKFFWIYKEQEPKKKIQNNLLEENPK